MSVNMHLPPPTVTGTAIPSDLQIKNSPLDNYRDLVTTRRQAQDGLDKANKKYKFKDRHSTPTGIKILGGTITLGGLIATGIYLFKKFKK